MNLPFPFKRGTGEQLSKEAAVEQDPQRLMELVNEINASLSEKEERLLRQQQVKKDSIAA